MSQNPFWNLSAEETSQHLETSLENGLSSAVAQARLLEYGKNTIETSKKTGWWTLVINQILNPLILILIAAGVITFVIQHYSDSFFIFIAVLVNVLLGYYQENKAERAIAGLKSYLRQQSLVVRDGKEQMMDVESLVPGDLIRLAQGDRVPADARVVSVNDFHVEEAILTGESMPVSKSAEPAEISARISDQTSIVFAGTLVTQGICLAIVCKTGMQTELGTIATLIANSEQEPTPLQAAITKFSLFLSVVLGGLTVVVFLIGLWAGHGAVDMFLTAVALAVSAIPEGLPISMTVILAVGVERMAKRKGVVRKLVAAEALGSTTVILTDKTGTLTMAKMTLSKIVPKVAGLTEDNLLARALVNTDVLIENPEDAVSEWRLNGRIMETALVRSAALRGMPLSDIQKKEHIHASMPFNAVQKFSVSHIQEGADSLLVFFGAPDILLARTACSEEQRTAWLNEMNTLAASGERVLGIATKPLAVGETPSFTDQASLEQLVFNGFLTFNDPVRPGIKETIARVHAAGIKTVILTGDHRGTAVAVAKQIGMSVEDRAVLDATELQSLSDAELMTRLPHLSVIARVTPYDKLRIAKLYQAQGEIVAMTGDGVNDAPSIKQANIGIAMGSGTEVARSVADLVLLDDNFETIIAAVEEGRQILGNIRKVLVYLLSNVADGLILIGGSLLVGLPLPMNALQILWVNFFTDSFPAVAYAFEKDADNLARKPDSTKMGLFSPFMRFLIVAIGLSTSALLFTLYAALLRMGFDPVIVRTFIFAAFGTHTLMVALSVRSLDRNILSYPVFSNMYLNGGILIGVVLTAAAIYLPVLQNLFGTVALPPVWIGAVVLFSIVNIGMIELAKYVFRRRA